MTLRISGKTNFKGQTVIKQPLSAYNVSSLYEPKLVSDFAGVNNSGIEYYRSSGSLNTFNSLFKFCGSSDNTRDSNATMVDSDGKLKWAPHNLLLYSEDTSQTGWVIQANTTVTPDQIVGPDGVSLANLAQGNGTDGFFWGSATLPPTTTNTKAIWLRGVSGGETVLLKDASFTVATLTCNLTTDWQLFTLTEKQPGVSVAIWVDDIPAGGIYFWGPHIYRSDLGGMVDNPDRGDSYVPTTSSVRYLARRNHHTWDGSNWVNSGILLETEARTNLFQYSEDIASYWIVDPVGALTLVSSNNSSPIGDVGHLYENDSDLKFHRLFKNFSTTAGTTYTFSLFAKAATSNWIYLLAYDGTTDIYYGNFDLENGTASGLGDLTIEPYGDGWYRCAITFESQGSSNFQIHFTEQLNTGTNPPSFAGTGKGAIIAGAQLEEGATPSSYIPTPGSNPDSTATRTAESLTIAAANMPWPTPNVIGTEAVTNPGGPFLSTTGYSAGGAATISVDTNRLKVSQTTGFTDGVFTELPSDAFLRPTVISFDIDFGSASIIQVQAGNGNFGNASIFTLNMFSGGTYNIVTAAGFGGAAGLTFKASSAADFFLSRVSVREIDPLSVSLQMQGKMTYADANDFRQVSYARWSETTTQEIELRLNTAGGFEGLLQYLQDAGSEVVLQSISDTYSPGILVPYNIASRHGSTFINGAVDGTALTENVTPTELPDLSATDFSLGNDYMGTIAQFRVWDKDITNTGIEEASQ